MLAKTRQAKSRPRQISLTSTSKLNSTKHYNHNITYHNIRLTGEFPLTMLAGTLELYVALFWTANTFTLLTLPICSFTVTSKVPPVSCHHLRILRAPRSAACNSLPPGRAPACCRMNTSQLHGLGQRSRDRGPFAKADFQTRPVAAS